MRQSNEWDQTSDAADQTATARTMGSSKQNSNRRAQRLGADTVRAKWMTRQTQMQQHRIRQMSNAAERQRTAATRRSKLDASAREEQQQ
jgi:hypothetical protein